MQKLSDILFTIYQYGGNVLLFSGIVRVEDKCTVFRTCMQFLFWPQGVANSLLPNLNKTRLVGAARALRCILGNCVLFDDAAARTNWLFFL